MNPKVFALFAVVIVALAQYGAASPAPQPAAEDELSEYGEFSQGISPIWFSNMYFHFP